MSSEFQTAFPAHRFSIAPMLDRTDSSVKSVDLVCHGVLLGTCCLNFSIHIYSLSIICSGIKLTGYAHRY
ncbi:hypothetical protein FPB06_21485 [Enterobacter hormaechei]|nr:hypothetical protein EKN90_20570 [Enterobacter hormaechei]TSD16422.1 hypothetical protein FPB06_21485 [Enterobacter hormaechei]TSD23489.1 hypothetical protein FPB07_07465 [Enterobacter hormaechei]